MIGQIKKRKINATNQNTDVDMANTNAQEETWLQEILTSNRYGACSGTEQNIPKWSVRSDNTKTVISCQGKLWSA